MPTLRSVLCTVLAVVAEAAWEELSALVFKWPGVK